MRGPEEGVEVPGQGNRLFPRLKCPCFNFSGHKARDLQVRSRQIAKKKSWLFPEKLFDPLFIFTVGDRNETVEESKKPKGSSHNRGSNMKRGMKSKNDKRLTEYIWIVCNGELLEFLRFSSMGKPSYYLSFMWKE